jgi:hypothetical protein
VNARLLAGALALAAVLVQFGLAAPFRLRASASADEFRRVRDERQQVAVRLAQKVRLEEAQRRTGRLPAADGARTPTRAARQHVVNALADSGVSRVRLGVTPSARPPLAVTVRLTGEGGFDDVVKLTGTIAGAGTGLLLQQVAFETRDARVGLTLEAVGVGPR